MTTPEPKSTTIRVMLAPSAIREAVNRTKATLLAASSSTVASLDGGHRIPVDHLWYLVDAATALLEHDCPEPAVTPALDPTQPAVSPVDTAALPRAAKRDLVEAVHDALRIDNIKAAAIALSGEDPGWLETTIREDLEAAILDSVVGHVAPLLSASAHRGGQADPREGELWSVLDWSLWGNGLGDVLRSEMANVMIAALTPEQREQAEACIKSWHERRSPSMAVGVGTQLQRERDEARAEIDRLKSYLLGRRNNLAQLLGQPASEEDTGWYGLCAQVQEREAGLRADLDRARAERDEATSHVHELRDFLSMGDDSDAAMVILQAQTLIRVGEDAEQHRDALSRMLRGMARRVGHARAVASEMTDRHLRAVNVLRAECEELHASLRRARVSGALPIPDDAAEREEVDRLIAYHMPNADDTDADFLATALMEYFGRDAASQSTPTTGPAPAAADGLTRLLWALALTEERFVSEFGTGPSEARDALHEVMRQANAMAAAPQAPAEPTEDIAAIRAAQIAALTSEDSARVDCSVAVPLTEGQMRRLLQVAQNLKDEEHHAGETIELLLDPKLGELLDDITELGPLLAAREDTAPPDDDCNDNLTAGFLRPSTPTEEV